MTTALLVDDEPNLTRHLARKLAWAWPELEVLGTARSGTEALDSIRRQAPDVVFLDIRMPGLDGLQVAQRLPSGVRVVFVTAYDDYAVQAFDTAAVDYLLKPVSDERLARTVERLRAAPPDVDALARLLGGIRPPTQAPDQQYLHWIRAGQGDTVTLVPVSTVAYFQADRKYTSVRTAAAEHLIRTSIGELASRLDPQRFWRIHRGVIVAADEIAEARRDLGGRYHLTLRSRPETLRVSRSYAHQFKQM